jgi:DsbC/DsbD-like thiol-disulfide interchange protein
MSSMRKIILGSLVIGSFIAVALPWTQTSSAGEFSSPWADNPYARARLIATGYPDVENNPQAASAGIQIELDPKWKTYWRNPGGSGIPIQAKWDGSKNVKSIEVRWPAPYRFINKYGMTIGYKNEVVLPVKIVPEDKNAPIQLALELNYGVCLDICLPANAMITLEIKPENLKPGPFNRKLQRFIKKVPKPLTSPPGLRVKNLKLSGSGEQTVLAFEVENPTGETLVDVFVEGDETLYFDTPNKFINKGTLTQVEVPVSGAKSAQALSGKKLRFTLVGRKSSVDQYWTIDG